MRHTWMLLWVTCLVFSYRPAPGLGQCAEGWAPGQGVPGVGGDVNATTTWDPDGAGPQPELLVVGGSFAIAGDVVANRIVAWDGTSWQPLGSGMNSDVRALTVYDGELIAGGSFTTAGGVSANRIARWNGTSWQPLGSGMNNVVYALTVYNGELIAGGSFTTAGGVSANRIARWNGTSWQPLGSGMNGVVYALTVYNGELIVGGFFTTAGGVSANYIARWNGTSWQALGAGISGLFGSSRVHALTVYNGELIAGGYFTTAGGVSANRIARWNGTSWQALGSGMSGGEFFSGVYAFTTYNGALIAGGSFTAAGGVSANNIARWNGTTWQPLGSGISGGPFSGVVALTVYNGALIAGGDFATAGGHVSAYWARWRFSCPRGDLNCDSVVDVTDLPLFVDALLNAPAVSACAAYTANVNGDTYNDGTPAVDGRDVQSFVGCLLGGACP